MLHGSGSTGDKVGVRCIPALVSPTRVWVSVVGAPPNMFGFPFGFPLKPQKKGTLKNDTPMCIIPTWPQLGLPVLFT